MPFRSSHGLLASSSQLDILCCLEQWEDFTEHIVELARQPKQDLSSWHAIQHWLDRELGMASALSPADLYTATRLRYISWNELVYSKYQQWGLTAGELEAHDSLFELERMGWTDEQLQSAALHELGRKVDDQGPAEEEQEEEEEYIDGEEDHTGGMEDEEHDEDDEDDKDAEGQEERDGAVETASLSFDDEIQASFSSYLPSGAARSSSTRSLRSRSQPPDVPSTSSQRGTAPVHVSLSPSPQLSALVEQGQRLQRQLLLQNGLIVLLLTGAFLLLLPLFLGKDRVD